MKLNKDYWQSRYKNQQTGWDLGTISTPLRDYFDQLPNKELKILIPGAGNAYEAQYLFDNGFRHVYILDFAEEALQNFKNRVPDFPENQLICEDFFKYRNQFDLIIEQTFFCALSPEQRTAYVHQMKRLLLPKGKLAGLLFTHELTEVGPPFGGSREEYIALFSKHFNIKTLENCYNSIPPRMDRELFYIFENL